jgi:lauroyl/myristoyl acyltransferase
VKRLSKAVVWTGMAAAIQSARRLPPPVLETAFAGLGLLQGVLRPSRARRAYRWASGLERPGLRRWRLGAAVLANRGRAIALSGLPALVPPETFRRRVTIEGAEHLAAAARGGGTILLGLHVLPGVATLALAAHGHRLVPTGMAGAFKGWTLAQPSWAPLLDEWRRGGILWRDERSAAGGLAHLLSLLLQGATVHLTADGPFGREAFRISLPAGALVVRSGWWTLRRLTRATTLPILARREGRRLVVAIHAPLPEPADDPGEDLRACRASLAPLVAELVRRAPAQCEVLATWPDTPTATAAAREPASKAALPDLTMRL